MRVPNPLKPWFLFRPGQLVRRVARALFPPADPVQVVDLPWGCSIEVDTRETVGRSIWTAGVHDLAVVEVLMRLADPHQLVLDVGANIGAMTGALARRAGEVWAFEPHPVVYPRLAGNVARFAGRAGFAPCRVFDVALSDTDGEAGMETPPEFGHNNGIGRISAGASAVRVRTARLDTVLAGRAVGVMKLDVEGHELAVLMGAASALGGGRVDHVLFEDHGGPDGHVGRYLAGLGFALFGVGWRMTGPVLATAAGVHHRYEAPNYLATRDPAGAAARCQPRGWQALRGVGRRGRRPPTAG